MLRIGRVRAAAHQNQLALGAFQASSGLIVNTSCSEIMSWKLHKSIIIQGCKAEEEKKTHLMCARVSVPSSLAAFVHTQCARFFLWFFFGSLPCLFRATLHPHTTDMKSVNKGRTSEKPLGEYLVPRLPWKQISEAHHWKCWRLASQSETEESWQTDTEKHRRRRQEMYY